MRLLAIVIIMLVIVSGGNGCGQTQAEEIAADVGATPAPTAPAVEPPRAGADRAAGQAHAGGEPAAELEPEDPGDAAGQAHEPEEAGEPPPQTREELYGRIMAGDLSAFTSKNSDDEDMYREIIARMLDPRRHRDTEWIEHDLDGDEEPELIPQDSRRRGGMKDIMAIFTYHENRALAVYMDVMESTHFIFLGENENTNGFYETED